MTDAQTSKRYDLDAMKLRATGLLALAGAAWFGLLMVPEGTIQPFWLGLWRTMAEAALVGGLADWFAVTALFRHPLGIPIPHTAIVPRNKDRIGEGLARFLRNNFLDPEHLTERLRRRGLALRFALWLQERPNRASVAARLTAAVPVLLGALDDRGVRRLFAEALRDGLGRADLTPVVSGMFSGVAEQRLFSPAIDRMIPHLRTWLGNRRDAIAEIVGRQTGFWIPEAVDARIAGLVVDGVNGWLGDMEKLDNEDRQKLEAWIGAEIAAMGESERTAALVAQARDLFAFSPAVEKLAGASWADLRTRLEADIASPEPRLTAEIDAALSTFADALDRDHELQTRLDAVLERFLLEAIAPMRDGIASYVEKTVQGWDGEQLAERIELEAGRDLQFVRINGTIVGALIGAVLFVISRAFQ